MKKEQKGNYYAFFITIILIGLLVIFMPEIYNIVDNIIINKDDTPDSEKYKTEKPEEIVPLTLNSAEVKNLFIPITRTNNYETATYYSNDSITINDISNKDLLINAFLQLYDGSISPYEGAVNGRCLNQDNHKQLKETYIKSEIESKFGKNVEFTYEDFEVPVSSQHQYAGKWHYDQNNKIFIYQGTCDTTKPTSYYDLVSFYDVESEDNNKTIYVYAYVAFAKLDNNNYVIYEDSNLTTQITSGTASSASEVQNIFQEYVKDNPVKKYKYTYKKGLCTYGEYCMEKGEWING